MNQPSGRLCARPMPTMRCTVPGHFSRWAVVATTQLLLLATSQARVHPSQRLGREDCSGWIERMKATDASMRNFSQKTQDGILRTIFERIGVANRHCVEFGFGYVGRGAQGEALFEHAHGAHGHVLLNTLLLRKQGWNATYFDALVDDPVANVRRVVLTESNIAAAFASAAVPVDVDYVSIDVDSIDVWLLRGLLQGGYRPRVISAEFNANFGVDQYLALPRKWHAWSGSSAIGSGAAALNLVAEAHGYRVVHLMPVLLDMFFVRGDLLRRCDNSTLPAFEDAARGVIPRRIHHTCTPAEARRFVDVRLMMRGFESEARAKALEELARANAFFAAHSEARKRGRLQHSANVCNL